MKEAKNNFLESLFYQSPTCENVKLKILLFIFKDQKYVIWCWVVTSGLTSDGPCMILMNSQVYFNLLS